MRRSANKMGCGCDLGCACELGDGCEMGCGCGQKLGQKDGPGKISPLWFVVGAGAGIGLWYLLRNLGKPDSTVDTVAAPMPPITPPSRYGNLQAVAVRLDEIKTLYRSGRLTPEQAIAEADGLITAANNFPAEGERVNEVLVPILNFKAEVEDYIQFQKSLEPIPAASNSPRGSMFA